MRMLCLAATLSLLAAPVFATPSENKRTCARPDVHQARPPPTNPTPTLIYLPPRQHDLAS